MDLYSLQCMAIIDSLVDVLYDTAVMWSRMEMSDTHASCLSMNSYVLVTVPASSPTCSMLCVWS